MRVCFVSFEFPPKSLVMGGAGTYGSVLVNGLKERGVDVLTITTGDRTVCERNLYRLSVPNIEYWRRFFFSRSAAGLLRELGKKEKFDLVHFNEPYIISGALSLPIVCTFHSTQLKELELSLKEHNLGTLGSISDLAVKNPVGYLCDTLVAHRADRIICPSLNLANALRYCFVDRACALKKIRVVPNGIRFQEFDEADGSSAFLDKYRLERESFLLYVGRLKSLKGAQYLIRAFQNVKREDKKLKLVIAGRGEFESYLKKIALGKSDIIFTGHVESIAIKKSLYQNSLALVVPSRYETFPMVVLEAMACGRPIIASNVGGIPLLVEHGKNGFLVKPGDIRALETFIKVLRGDPDLGRKMGTNSRRMVETQFSADKMTDETLKVYDSLLQLH